MKGSSEGEEKGSIRLDYQIPLGADWLTDWELARLDVPSSTQQPRIGCAKQYARPNTCTTERNFFFLSFRGKICLLYSIRSVSSY